MHNVTPAFAFGHGLSYTSFGYSALKVQPRAAGGEGGGGSGSSGGSSSTVSFTLTNTGTVAGAEAAQLYVRYPAAAEEPFRQLRGVNKTKVLAPGASRTVSFELTDRWLSIWDVEAHQWALVKGGFEIMVGAASDDIRLRGTLAV